MNKATNKLTTKEAAARLDITPRRVRALIENGRLASEQYGRDHLIKESDLDTVRTRKSGRPKKAESAAHGKEAASKAFKTIFDSSPNVIGVIKDGLPTDVSTNKKYLKNLGRD